MNRRHFVRNTATGVLGSLLYPFSVSSKQIDHKSLKPNFAKFVWLDSAGLGRNLYGNFRKNIQIQGEVKEAKFHIFADTSYQLFLNGKFLNQGPVRFDPRFPVYDTYDLKAVLQPGKNVLAVQVNYFGNNTYKSMPNRAGLIAWGEVKSGDKPILLDTNKKNNWRGVVAKEHGIYAPKMSFALNSIDIFDQANEEEGWKTVAFNDSHWPSAIELKQQDSWGLPSAREIPFMSFSEVKAKKALHVLPLRTSEIIYSFFVPVSDFFNQQKGTETMVAFKTWVFSERDQNITVGTFFGENWINGQLMARGVELETRSMRINQQWPLKKGWNFMFGKVNAYHDIVEQYFAIPKGSGVYFSGDKKENSPILFYRSQGIVFDKYSKLLKESQMPFGENESLSSVGGWLPVKDVDKAQNPCRDTSWDEYGQQFEAVEIDKVIGKTFSKSNYPEGFSVTLDLGETLLIYPFIKLSGVRGSTLDITYSELLEEDQQHLVHRFNYCGGDKILCSKDSLDWFPTHPRGTRFLKITVRNLSSDIVLETLEFKLASYPVIKKGTLTVSDKALENIWLMGERTQAANMEDAYVDCVTRERGMYGRDTIIQYHNNLATFGDHALMKRCMELYGQSPDPSGKFRAVYPHHGEYTIADFALNMVEGYKAYYDNTGDKLSIERDWNAITKNLQWFHKLADERGDLLLDSEWHKRNGERSFYGGFHGDIGIPRDFLHNTGIHCMFTCTYLIALRDAEALAKAINKKDALPELQKRISILSDTIADKFWDSEKKCFADNIKKTSHSPHASLFAMRAGVVSKERVEDIRRHVSVKLKSMFVNGIDPTGGVYMSPSFAFYIFDGLYQLGLPKIAQTLMKEGWGWMLSQGMPNTPEYFNFDTSMCHAWSASPTYFLSKNLLGIHYPEAPNLNVVEIKVSAEEIESVKGAWPHPLGLVEVSWHMEGSKRIFDYVKAPTGVKVNVIG
ncbi:MAG TPA: alpha-L-rhamnosidase N-terminal domain-containing protein [Cytophagaceae bacterium]|jgi:hypothetical protein